MLSNDELSPTPEQNHDFTIDRIFNRSCGLADDGFSDKSDCRVIASACFHQPYPCGLFFSCTPASSVCKLTPPFYPVTYRRQQEPARHRVCGCRLADVVPARSGTTHVAGRPDNYELPGEIRAGGLVNTTPLRLTSDQLVTHKIPSPATACPYRKKRKKQQIAMNK